MFIGILIVLVCILALVCLEERRKRLESRAASRTSKIWNGAERRKNIRVNCNLDIRYNLVSAREKAGMDSVSRDISAGGTKLILEQKMSPGSLLEMDVALPQEKNPLKVTGKVAWQREIPGDIKKDGIRRFATGIEFVRISHADRQRLSQFVKTQVLGK